MLFSRRKTWTRKRFLVFSSSLMASMCCTWNYYQNYHPHHHCALPAAPTALSLHLCSRCPAEPGSPELLPLFSFVGKQICYCLSRGITSVFQRLPWWGCWLIILHLLHVSQCCLQLININRIILDGDGDFCCHISCVSQRNPVWRNHQHDPTKPTCAK